MEGNVPVGGVRNGGREIAKFTVTVNADKEVTSATVELVDMAGITPSETIRGLESVSALHRETVDFVAGGTDESGEPLPPLADGTAIDYADITVLVDGAEVEVSTLLIGENYYVSAEGINTLVGADAAVVDGVLVVGETAQREGH